MPHTAMQYHLDLEVYYNKDCNNNIYLIIARLSTQPTLVAGQRLLVA